LSETYERGLKDGAANARLDEAFIRLNKINGNIERHAETSEQLAKEVRQTRQEIFDELRKMNSAAEARDLAVRVAKETLEKETSRLAAQAESLREERALALELPVRTWSLRADKATVISVVAATGFAASTIYFSLHL